MKNRKIYWLFLAPSLLGVAVFYCVPFLYAAYYAVIDNIGSGQFVGLQNFIDVLQNDLFRTAAKNTLIFMALAVPLGMALALLTALCLRKISRGRQLLSLCLLLPLVVPSGTGAYFWKILFDQNGLLIRTLVLFGVPHESLIQLNGRMAILVFVFLWKTVVGTQLDPEDVLRADGAGGRRTLGTVSAGDVDIPCADDVRGVFDVGRQRV